MNTSMQDASYHTANLGTDTEHLQEAAKNFALAAADQHAIVQLTDTNVQLTGQLVTVTQT
eukprot:1669222-Ditylum_brightwellii.AAC.2